MDAVCTVVVGSVGIGCVLDAGSDREDRSYDSVMHIHHLCRIAPHRNMFFPSSACSQLDADQLHNTQ